MKKLLPFLSEYKLESFLAPLFKMLEAMFELIVPLVVASIINDGIRQNNLKFVLSRAAILVVLAVVGMIASITAQYFAAKAATGFATNVRHALFDKIQTFSFNEFDRLGTSTLITRMTNDVNQAQSTVNMVLRLFLRSPFIVAGAFVMALFINAKISLIFLLVIVLLSVVVTVIMKVTVPMYRNVQNTLDDVTLMTRESLTGARVIRAFTEEEQSYNRFNEKNSLLAHFQRSVGRISALMNPITYVIINLGIVFLIYNGAVKVNDNTLQFVDDDTCYDNHAVAFDNVSLKYNQSDEESLTDISFYADRGEVIGIIGSTGSGKSSLVDLIPHYYDSTKGRVTVFGKNVKSYDKTELRSKIGFVMQKAVLFSGTVRDNIRWGKADATDDEINEALKVAQIYDNIYEKNGLDTVIEQNGANLSGGQKQRLSIARALVSKPEIIVLDDSASALDFATEKALREAILSLDYKPTLFIVSERTSSILSADRIVVLDDGHTVGIGTNKELLKSCEVYKEIYLSEFSDEEVAVNE